MKGNYGKELHHCVGMKILDVSRCMSCVSGVSKGCFNILSGINDIFRLNIISKLGNFSNIIVNISIVVSGRDNEIIVVNGNIIINRGT